MAGERGRLVADALHEAAVAGDDVGVVVDEVGAEAVAQDALGDGHADGVAEALAERAGRDLDAGRVAGLGVARRARLELAERLDVVELEAVAAEVQHRVLEDRGVAVGEHEAVAVGPRRVGRVVLHDPAVEHVGERGERHRRALVAALGAQRGVHGEAADQRDRLGLDVGGEQRRASRRPYPMRAIGEPGRPVHAGPWTRDGGRGRGRDRREPGDRRGDRRGPGRSGLGRRRQLPRARRCRRRRWSPRCVAAGRPGDRGAGRPGDRRRRRARCSPPSTTIRGRLDLLVNNAGIVSPAGPVGVVHGRAPRRRAAPQRRRRRSSPPARRSGGCRRRRAAAAG